MINFTMTSCIDQDILMHIIAIIVSFNIKLYHLPQLSYGGEPNRVTSANILDLLSLNLTIRPSCRPVYMYPLLYKNNK